MNHETAVAMAVVLAVIIITILYSLISGGIGIGEQGIGNITDRTDDGSDGPSFASLESDAPPSFESSIKGRETTVSL